jgi:ParB/RepB/Spo0J family partition protein
LIDFANLRVAAENPRKTPADEAAHLSLVASMKAHGQITNILVRPGDTPGLFDIIDDGRRFQAAKAAELEQLKADLYEGTSDAGEIGAAANMMRAAMHPLDEAKVIARLAANGESLDSIGLRFGKGQRWVEQRRKLDRLSPKAKTLFREARIDMAAAQALTLARRCSRNSTSRRPRTTGIMTPATSVGVSRPRRSTPSMRSSPCLTIPRSTSCGICSAKMCA